MEDSNLFYAPLTDGAVWGADLLHSPVIVNPQFNGDPELFKIFMVPADGWSERTPAWVM
jgi:hypothetical protein